MTMAPKVSPATKLVELAQREGAELFHTPDGDAYATVRVGRGGDPERGHHETWGVTHAGFRRWLQGRAYRTTNTIPSRQALDDALTTLEGLAQLADACEPVAVRIAEHAGAIYLDLADADWRVVKVTAERWHVLQDRSPVRFRRTRGMLPLPVPEEGGHLDGLRELIPVDDDGWVLIVAYLVAALRPDRPFPVAGLRGGGGSGKTTGAGFMRGLVDPNTAALRSPPREERDLILAAVNGWIVGFDNLSRIPPWLSDAFCRLSTGAGFGCRQLYKDGDEVLFAAKRPVLFTSIEEVAIRGDLADRLLDVSVPAIDEQSRKREQVLQEVYLRRRPALLGALLTVVAGALRDAPAVTLRERPRMLDFAEWVTAAEAALGWKQGRFLEVYQATRSATREAVLEASPIAAPLCDLMAERAEWEGTATVLLADLADRVDDSTRRLREWPRTPRGLRAALDRLGPDLRATGLEVSPAGPREKNPRRGRVLRIQRTEGRVPADGSSWTSSNEKRSAGTGSGRLDGVDGRSRHLFPSPLSAHEQSRLEAEAAAGDPLALLHRGPR